MPTDELETAPPHPKRVHVDGRDDDAGIIRLKRRRVSIDHLKHGWWRKPEQIKLSHADYTVGWICALPIELAASHAMLDKIHESLPTVDNDTNAYILGSIGEHNIAMACLPFGQYGTINAATVAGNMMRSFKSIRFGFMVGIGGGVPGEQDIRLGDIVVGTHVIQHDLGKVVAGDGFQGTATPKAPPQVLLTAISKLRAFHEANASQISVLLHEMQDRYPGLAEYTYPSSRGDHLFLATYDHEHLGDCSNCSLSQLHHRPTRSGNHPRIHYGGIASGDQVIKSARHRDELAKKHGIICYEMEAAGLSDNFSCIVIRGICDYADSHKNKEWQRYAAATAAAYAKELLSAIAPTSFQGSSDIYRSSSPPDIGTCLSQLMMQSCTKAPMAHETLQARRDALLESIRFEQIDARHTTIKTAHSKTCDWLIQHPLYDRWLDKSCFAEHRGFFWISGKPGAGKSTIMKFAYNRAKRASKSDDAMVSFFFNARGDQLEKSTFGLYRSLFLQLLERFSDLQTVLDNTALIPPRATSCPNSDTLQELFRNAIISLGQRRLTCFVDALDECDESQVRDMVVYFEDLGEYAVTNGAQLRICFSSRHYPHIDIRHGLRLVLEDQAGHGQDLERYVRSHLRAGKGKHVDDIRSKVLQKAGGVFMWVVLVCKILNEEFVRGRRAISRVEQRLREIPAGLSDLFKDMLRRDHTNMEDLLLCLQWVLFAKRPMSLKEFYFAMLSGLPELQQVPTIYDPETETDEDMRVFVTGSSKGLAEVTKSKKETVQFIHESVRDFLIKDNGLQELWPDHENNFEASGHEKLKQCCYSHIAADVTRQIQLPNVKDLPKANSEDAKKLRQVAVDKFPFLEYATENIFHHSNIAGQRMPQKAFLQKFPLVEWIRLNDMLEKHQVRRYTPEASLTYIFAERNFCNLLQEHAGQFGDIHMDGERYRHPFFAALANDNLAAAKILLGQNARSISTEELFRHPMTHPSRRRDNHLDSAKRSPDPLHWALAEEPRWIIARLIIDSGHLNFSCLNTAGQNYIHSASIAGSNALLQQLLEKASSQEQEIRQPLIMDQKAVKLHGSEIPAIIDKLDKHGRTPLWYACSSLNEVIIRQLLDWGATRSMASEGKFEIHDAEKFSPSIAKLLIDEKLVSKKALLEVAVKFISEDVVRYILNSNTGSSVSEITHNAVTLVETVAASNHDTILRLLLDNGAVQGSLKWKSHEVIIQAYSNNDETAVRYFMENGADICDLLIRASSCDNKDLMKKLLLDGAQFGLEESVFMKALELLGEIEDEAGLKILMENNNIVDLNRVIGPALHLAATTGQDAMIKILLEGGRSADDGRSVPETRLDIPAGEAQEAAVTRGVPTGVRINPNILDFGGSSPLAKASSFGHKRTVEHLLEHGANANMPGFIGQPALHRASGAGHYDVVKLLLTHGADPDLKATGGETALHSAYDAGHYDMVKLLLAHGANPDLKETGGETTLHRASSNGDAATVKILLEHKADPSLQDPFDKTALHRASANGHSTVVKMLLAQGANANLLDAFGRTAHYRASEAGHDAVVRLLQDHGQQSAQDGTMSSSEETFSLNMDQLATMK